MNVLTLTSNRRVRRFTRLLAASGFVAAAFIATSASAHPENEAHSDMTQAEREAMWAEHGSDHDGDCCRRHGMMMGERDENAPPHSSGPYFRGGFGLGFASHGLIEDSDVIGQYTGASLNYEIAVGKFVAKNTALHLSFFGNTMPKPIERTGAIDGDLANGRKNYPAPGQVERFGVQAVGLGLTNYLGNSGLMFSVTPGIARLRARVDNGGFAISGDTDWGFAFDSLFGYEWRTSAHSSVGMGVTGGMYIIPDDDIDPARRGYNLGGRFFFAWD